MSRPHRLDRDGYVDAATRHTHESESRDTRTRVVRERSRARGAGLPCSRRAPRSSRRAPSAFDWPGNVRELENLVEREMIRNGDALLRFEEIGASGTSREGSPAERPGPIRLDEAMAAHIEGVLAMTVASHGRDRPVSSHTDPSSLPFPVFLPARIWPSTRTGCSGGRLSSGSSNRITP